jgi:hypothetical protein
MSQEQNLEALLGPSGKSDYSVGDTIKFREGASVLSGEIIHIEAAGTTPVSKTPHPLTYHVDCSDGWPHLVYPSQVIIIE